MSPFGSRSNSIDSYNNDLTCNENILQKKKCVCANVRITTERRQRDKYIDESYSNPSPSPESFLLKMKKIYDR